MNQLEYNLNNLNLFPRGWKIPIGNKLLNNDGLTQKEKCKSPKMRTHFFELFISIWYSEGQKMLNEFVLLFWPPLYQLEMNRRRRSHAKKEV